MAPTSAGFSIIDAKSRGDFDNVIKGSVHDALWALSMQWKIGEFKGEDTGSAIKTMMRYKVTKINRIQTGRDNVQAYQDEEPLESRVQREPLTFSLTSRIQLGKYWLNLMAYYGLGQNFQTLFIDAFPIKSPSTYFEKSNDSANQVRNLMKNRMVDGGKLYDELTEGKTASELANFVEDSHTSFDTTDLEALDGVMTDFQNHVNSLYSQPEGDNDYTWNPNRLEYSMKCSAPEIATGNEQTVLMADQFSGGHLDWYSFDIDPSETDLVENSGESINDGEVEGEAMRTFIPGRVRFPGMPTKRWWTMEDGDVNYTKIEDIKTSILGMVTKKFIYNYNNDWNFIPLEVEAGSMVKIENIVIKDTFGDYVYVGGEPQKPNQFSDDQWNMFKLNKRGKTGFFDNRLFLPPVVPQIMHSEPIEEIDLFRDEKANMAWGIESKVPNELGQAMDGAVFDQQIKQYLKGVLPDQSNETDTDSTHTDTDSTATQTGEGNGNIERFKYHLLSGFPEYWIPFIPYQLDNSTEEIAFLRATYPRIVDGKSIDYNDPANYVKPKGKMLREGLDQSPQEWYTIKEEEVPKAGVNVKRTFQRCRWYNGKTIVWIGRSKETGHGQGSSGLKFDFVSSKNDLNKS